MTEFTYRRLGNFTYHVLTEPVMIRSVLTRWILPEIQMDHQEDPGQPWTVEWLERAPLLAFKLAAIPLALIQPRADLMSYETPTYCFRRSLHRRADEREQAMLRGVSIEPLCVMKEGYELMDGYTRYSVLKRYAQELVYAYVGEVEP